MRSILLPDKNNNPSNYELGKDSLIIIGANGAGKSRLGAWIEQNDPQIVHRVSAQRSLQFESYIELKSYNQSERMLWSGSNHQYNDMYHKEIGRWNNRLTTGMLNDFNTVLSTLVAKQRMQDERYLKECKKRDSEGVAHNPVPKTVVDTLYDIWNSVYPHREIKIEDAQVFAIFSDSTYQGNEMSDGERVALYLIAQCLAIPANKIILIDEPEVHLHRSIMNRLWKTLEEIRDDCLFIYITHDTQFAASHNQADKIWVKEFDGSSWDFEIVKEDDTLPEQCLLDILGNRKNTIFVEGTVDSYDTAIYREIYKDFYVVPCGSSLNVIDYTRSVNSNPQLHHLKAFGIVDRDFKSEQEIDYLRTQNIHVLGIAEVENLFCIEEVLEAVNEHQAHDNKEMILRVKNYIVGDRFGKQIIRQINKSITSQVKYKLTTYDVSGIDYSDIENKINSISDYINLKDLKHSVESAYYSIYESQNYSEVLKVFNEKGLSSSIGWYMGIDNKDYCKLVLRLLKKGNTQIAEGMKKYLPSFEDNFGKY